MLSALGVRVTIIERRPTMLDFVDREIIEALRYHMRRRDAIFRLGEHVTGVRVQENGLVRAEMESGKRVTGDALLYTVGRQSNADQLQLDRIGIDTDPRGRIPVNENFQTTRPHVYAAGDCIGFPALASTSMEQGRLASTHMFDGPSLKSAPFFPYGIYTVPEISMVGKTEQELTAERVPYEVGKALYENVTKAQMVGDRARYAEADLRPRLSEAAQRTCHRRRSHRDHPHRPRRHRPRRHHRVLPRQRLQLPHLCRGVQSRRLRRLQQDRGGAVAGKGRRAYFT